MILIFKLMHELYKISINKSHDEIWNNLGIVVPFLKTYLKTQRWSGLLNVNEFTLQNEMALIFKKEEKVKIQGFILNVLINGQKLESGTKIFLPLIFYLEKNQFNIKPEIQINTNSSKIYLNQAEFLPDFLNILIENFKKGASFKLKNDFIFKFELMDENYFEDFVLIESDIFKKGETTNFLTKIKGNKGNLFLKSYRRFSNVREPLLVRELFKVDFKNIPKPIGFVKLENNKEEILLYLQEFVNFENDLGYYFWDNLKNRIENNVIGNLNNDKDLNDDLSKLVDIIINFHYKSYKLKHPLFEREKYSIRDLEFFQSSQLEIMNEILNEKRESLLIFQNISERFQKIQDDLTFLEKFLDFFKITVHQDLHLGQILVEKNIESGKKLYITDLEGDPNRPAPEKYETDLIFRDLATIITAFHYIKINNLLKINDLNRKILKQIESLSAESLGLEKPECVKITNDWTDYLTNNLITLYFKKFSVIFTGEKKIDLKKFKKGVEIYVFDRLIREIFYELKFRKDNFVIPLTILNNLFEI